MDLMENPLAQSYGLVQEGLPSNTLLFTNFIESVQEWYNKISIPTQNVTSYECNETCNGSLTAPGLDVNCTVGSANLDLGDSLNQGDSIFSVNFTRTESVNGDPIFGIDVIYSSSVDDNCIATMVIEHYDIGAAFVLQDVRIQNGSVTLSDAPPELLVRYSSSFDAVDASSGSHADPLSMLNWIGVCYFASRFTLDFNITDNVALAAHGIIPSGQQNQVVNTSSTLVCDYTFFSPVKDI